jgi:hypothetical protein
VVNESNDGSNDDYNRTIEVLKVNRVTNGRYMNSNRLSVEENEEMGLYFIENDPQKQPNRKALEYHKTACLIWRMAGGAESDNEYCSDDDQDLVMVDTAALKRRFKIQDSAETLNVDNI